MSRTILQQQLSDPSTDPTIRASLNQIAQYRAENGFEITFELVNTAECDSCSDVDIVDLSVRIDVRETYTDQQSVLRYRYQLEPNVVPIIRDYMAKQGHMIKFYEDFKARKQAAIADALKACVLPYTHLFEQQLATDS